MKLAVSSIAWANEEDAAVAEKLRNLGVAHVELAPTKLWQDPTKVDAGDARGVTSWWARYGIEVVAFQSMLFSRPDLKIFEDENNRQACLRYLKGFLTLAATMGARKLVFGSPKNRQRGDMSIEQALEIAQAFFYELGQDAKSKGVALCLEPNAPQYNCDFITSAKEGEQLVRSVQSEGFKLHLDTACMTLAGDDIGTSIHNASDVLEHFHISAPMLGQVEESDGVDHTAAASALHEIGYDGFVSIEMRPGEMGENADRVEKAVKLAQGVYGV